ncbi:hypothetical protein FQZ97_1052450 [compost metagenome]
MLAADQRNPVAKTGLVPFNQRIAMSVFFCCHLLENFCRLRKLVAQAVGIGKIDACIVLFRGYGKRQNFLFGKRIERTSVVAEESAEHFGNPKFRIVLK